LLNAPESVASEVFDAEMPMFPTDGHYDRTALDVVVKSLVDTGRTDAKTDVRTLIKEQFLD
jgi:hypothetical protein